MLVNVRNSFVCTESEKNFRWIRAIQYQLVGNWYIGCFRSRIAVALSFWVATATAIVSPKHPPSILAISARYSSVDSDCVHGASPIFLILIHQSINRSIDSLFRSFSHFHRKRWIFCLIVNYTWYPDIDISTRNTVVGNLRHSWWTIEWNCNCNWEMYSIDVANQRTWWRQNKIDKFMIFVACAAQPMMNSVRRRDIRRFLFVPTN